MSAPTTRSFPRTLAQAFPKDPRNAYPVERYRRERFDQVAGVLLAVAIGVCGALALVHWWSS